MPPLYVLNLFDLAENDLYRQYSRRSVGAVGKHGGKVVALGSPWASWPERRKAARGPSRVPPRSSSSGRPGRLSTLSSTTRTSRICTRCEKTEPKTTCGGPTNGRRI